jgi:hypothetical protein
VARKTKEAEEKGLETLWKTRMRKRGDKEPSKARITNRYVAIVASIGRFPPLRESRPDKERPLWSERRLALVLAKNMLLESVSLMDLLEKMRHIVALCDNSKRKRLPVLYRLLVPKQTHMGKIPLHTFYPQRKQMPDTRLFENILSEIW